MHGIGRDHGFGDVGGSEKGAKCRDLVGLFVNGSWAMMIFARSGMGGIFRERVVIEGYAAYTLSDHLEIRFNPSECNCEIASLA